MSILSQIGVVILILCIVFILIRSNKTLEEVSKEGEHFVDEWDLRQQRKEERLLEKQNKKLMKKEQRKKGSKSIEETETEEIETQETGPEELEDDFAFSGEYGTSGYDNREREYEYGNDDRNPEKYDFNWNERNARDCDFNRDEKNTEYGSDLYGRKKACDSDRFDEEMEASYDGYRKREPDNVIPMNKYVNAELTLVEMDENHRPVRRINVTQFPFSVGRSKQNQLVLDDLCVARMHCRIIKKDGIYIMEDVGSANKLFADGRVVERLRLTDQLRVYIGNVEFKVELKIHRSNSTRLYQTSGEYHCK